MTQAASQVTDWEGAWRLLGRMASEEKPIDAAAYGHAVAACAKANRPEEGRSLLERLASEGVAAEARAYNQVISAYARQRQWSEAINLLETMRAAGVTPTVISYNAALSACSKAARWTEATELLQRMERGEGGAPPPDVISYSTVVTACQKAAGGQTGASASATALEILERMQTAAATTEEADGAQGASAANATGGRRLKANVFTYTSAITALTEAGEWEKALRTFETMPRDVERNDVIINAAVCAANLGCDWVRARSILEEALLGGVVPRTSSFNVAISTAAAARQPAAALAILRRMRTAGVRRNLLTYNAALGALELGGRWQQAQRLLRDMERARVRPTLISYNLALGACAKAKASAGAADAAIDILVELQRKNLVPDVITYSSVIAALSRRGDWQRVVGLLGAMQQTDGVEPNAFSFSAAIAACERAGEWEKALALFGGLRDAGGAVDASVYHAAISAAASASSAGSGGGGVERARALLDQMVEAGFPADLRAYNGVLKACERAADWDTAIDTLSLMKAERIAPDAISYTSAVGALGRGREWEKALSLWMSMLSDGVAPDALALRTLLRALVDASQWPTALAVFDAVAASEDSHVCTASVYAVALGACALGQQPERARQYMAQMVSAGLTPTVVCYNQLASAHASAGDWQAALGVWKDMVRQGMQPDAASYQVVYDACDAAGAQAEAKALLEFAERQGVPLMALAGVLAGGAMADESGA